MIHYGSSIRRRDSNICPLPDIPADDKLESGPQNPEKIAKIFSTGYGC